MNFDRHKLYLVSQKGDCVTTKNVSMEHTFVQDKDFKNYSKASTQRLISYKKTIPMGTL
jgi:hypothetical protein